MNASKDTRVFRSIIIQHCELVAFHWGQTTQTEAPELSPQHLALSKQQLEASIDALRIAGSGAWPVAIELWEMFTGANEWFMLCALYSYLLSKDQAPEDTTWLEQQFGRCEDPLMKRATREAFALHGFESDTNFVKQLTIASFNT